MENPKINIECWPGQQVNKKVAPCVFFRKNQKKKCIFIHVKMWYRCWPVDPMLTKVAPSIFSCKIDVFRTVNDWNRTKTHSCSSCWKLTKNQILREKKERNFWKFDFPQFSTGATAMSFCAIPIVHGAKDIYFTWKIDGATLVNIGSTGQYLCWSTPSIAYFWNFLILM